MKKTENWSNQEINITYDPETMKCTVSGRNGNNNGFCTVLRLPLVCTLPGEESFCFTLVPAGWESARISKGERITFQLEAEEDSRDFSPILKYSLFIPDQGAYMEEEAVMTVCKDAELTSFYVPWYVNTDAEAEYLSIPFSDSNIEPGPAALENIPEGSCLYEGLLLNFDSCGVVAARVPANQKPQWIGLSRDHDGRVSVEGIQAGLVKKSDSDKENYHPPVLSRNKAFSFLKTRYMFYSGGENTGLYLYREYMKGKGICMEQDYNPPFNYCIYYEHPGYFQKEQLLKEADLAASLGCTLLYTDQGWEDYFGNGVWDKTRLGEVNELAEQLAQKGLQLGVLVGMHLKAFCMPESAYRRNPAGEIEKGDPWNSVGICPQSPVWQRRKKMRLKKLAAQGISFMSFDFNNYENVCYSREHNHAGPSDEWGHAAAIAGLQAELKKECPDLLIEAHDWINAGTYTYPVYLFPESCQERWGFEYMWTPFEDYKSGRLRNLYYYNMAYEKPLYLHIDLADDSEHMAVFWYIASTVRHLGIGNFKRIPEQRKPFCQTAIARYCEIREYLVKGNFWGVNPLVHVHLLEEKGALVLLFHDQGDQKQIDLKLSESEVPGLSACLNRMEPVWGPAPDISMTDREVSMSVLLEAYDVSIVLLLP